MVSNENKLGKKFLILTDEKDVDLSLDIRRREIRYPYVASEGKKFSAVAPVCINTTRGCISNFSFKPVTKVKKEDVKHARKNYQAIEERREIYKVGIYIPMDKNNYIISFNRDYKTLVEAVEQGLRLHFGDIMLDKYLQVDPTAKSIDDLPKELQKEVDEKVGKFIDGFDAFEVVMAKSPNFACFKGYGIREDVEHEMKSVYFYKFNENVPFYDETMQAINKEVKNELRRNSTKSEIKE